MAVTLEQLDSFHDFARQKLQNGGAESIEELFDLWRHENPTPEEEEEIHSVILQGLDDTKAGRVRSADVVMNEIRRKHNLPAE